MMSREEARCLERLTRSQQCQVLWHVTEAVIVRAGIGAKPIARQAPAFDKPGWGPLESG